MQRKHCNCLVVSRCILYISVKTEFLSLVKSKTCLFEIVGFACLTPSLRKQNLFLIIPFFFVFSYKVSLLRLALIWCASILIQVDPFQSWQHIDSKRERNAIRWTPTYQRNQRQTRKPGVVCWNQLMGCSTVFVCIWFHFIFYSQAVIIITVFVISRVHYHTNGWWPLNSYKKH